jgi:general secretion pathway protein B
MSYILEALKKSQQERELGRVPTLNTTGMFEEDKVVPSRSHWPLLAVGLAAVAMVLALYAALRGPAPAPAPTSEAVGLAVPPDATPGVDSGQIQGPGDVGAALGIPEQRPTPATRDRAAPQRAVAGREDLSGLSLPTPEVAVPRGPVAPAALLPAPLIEPPPLKQAGRVRLTDPVDGLGYPGDAHDQDPEPPDAPDLEEELELQRQMEADNVEPWEDEDIADPAPTPVPRDLIKEIEAFKREVRGDHGTEKAPAKALSRSIDKDPQSLHLTPAQEADLPAYLMTAHVYDAEQSRRFVLINGLKYREGEKTREGMTVERILTQGAVLSHKGNPFFVPR